MNMDLLVPLLVTTVVAVASWFAVHQLNARRDRANKRREKVTELLIDAYRKIEKFPGGGLSPDNAAAFESAIADIQLLGSPTLIELAQSVAEAIPRNNSANADQLLVELRKMLRKELGLEAAPDKIVYLRIIARRVSGD